MAALDIGDTKARGTRGKGCGCPVEHVKTVGTALKGLPKQLVHAENIFKISRSWLAVLPYCGCFFVAVVLVLCCFFVLLHLPCWWYLIIAVNVTVSAFFFFCGIETPVSGVSLCPMI